MQDVENRDIALQFEPIVVDNELLKDLQDFINQYHCIDCLVESVDETNNDFMCKISTSIYRHVVDKKTFFLLRRRREEIRQNIAKALDIVSIGFDIFHGRGLKWKFLIVTKSLTIASK